MIRFKCPNCDTVLQVSREYAGQAVQCPTCSTQLITPQIPVSEPTLDKADSGSIICICGQCKSTYKVPAASAGRQVPCPKCGHTAQIPEEEQVVTDSQTMKFTCPTCRQSYCVLAKYAGKKFNCLACQRPCMIPKARRPAEDLLMLEPDDTPEEVPPPSPPEQKEAAPDQGLSFKLQPDEEPEEPDIAELDQLNLLPEEPPAAPSPIPPVPRGSARPQRPAPPTEKPKKTKEKSSGSAVKVIAGIVAGLFGFIIGFIIVYSLINRSASETETGTLPADNTPAPIVQKKEILDFVLSVAQYLNPKANNPWTFTDLKYQFPDEVYVTDSDIQSLEDTMDIGFFESIEPVIEASRMETGASYYLVRTSIQSVTGIKREMDMAIFEIEEESEFELTEMVNWIFGLTIKDENGTVLASVGWQNPDELIAQMDPLVEEYSYIDMNPSTRINFEEMAGSTLCTILIIVLIIAIITVISQIAVFISAGEPGWAPLVPIYRWAVMARIGEKPEWIGWICGLCEFFGGPLYIPYAIMGIFLTIAMARNMGRSILFGIGLCFLPFIFYPILAFSGKAYD